MLRPGVLLLLLLLLLLVPVRAVKARHVVLC
jgi:hypothetical protein